MPFVFCFRLSHSLPKNLPSECMPNSPEYGPQCFTITFNNNTLFLYTILSQFLCYIKPYTLLVLVFCPAFVPRCYSVLVLPCIIISSACFYILINALVSLPKHTSLTSCQSYLLYICVQSVPKGFNGVFVVIVLAKNVV